MPVELTINKIVNNGITIKNLRKSNVIIEKMAGTLRFQLQSIHFNHDIV